MNSAIPGTKAVSSGEEAILFHKGKSEREKKGNLLIWMISEWGFFGADVVVRQLMAS